LIYRRLPAGLELRGGICKLKGTLTQTGLRRKDDVEEGGAEQGDGKANISRGPDRLKWVWLKHFDGQGSLKGEPSTAIAGSSERLNEIYEKRGVPPRVKHCQLSVHGERASHLLHFWSTRAKKGQVKEGKL